MAEVRGEEVVGDHAFGADAATPEERRFFDWLLEHGARFPKILWPSYATASGFRGAVAREAIAANEPMLTLPKRLMLSPEAALASPIGPLLRRHHDDLRGDAIVCVFLLYERARGDESFFAPFLQVLPSPAPLSTWEPVELKELQDWRLLRRARSRRESIAYRHRRLVEPLIAESTDPYLTAEHFSLEKFHWAWNVVASRAFGRRLPWIALVPFADCLNHANVETKYDYDVPEDGPMSAAADDERLNADGLGEAMDATLGLPPPAVVQAGPTVVPDGNGLFRLYPTGRNAYGQGAEVFNSYGRRPNDNLLLEYGFVLPYNEWDEATVSISLIQELRLQAQTAAPRPNGTAGDGAAEGAADTTANGTADGAGGLAREQIRERLGNTAGHASFDLRLAKPDLGLPAFARSCHLDLEQEIRATRGDSAAIGGTSSVDKPLSPCNEASAMQTCLRGLREAGRDFGAGTSLDEDLAAFAALDPQIRRRDAVDASLALPIDDAYKFWCALGYRLTRKLILRVWELVLDALAAALDAVTRTDGGPASSDAATAALRQLREPDGLLAAFATWSAAGTPLREVEERYGAALCAHEDWRRYQAALVDMLDAQVLQRK